MDENTGASVDFTLPNKIKDFLFDLHDAVRRSRRVEEVQTFYDVKFKEITDQYFSNSAWPDSKSVANEVGNDEQFLVFYKEMTFRHATAKLKPQAADHIRSWSNYSELFEVVLKASPEDLCLHTKWIYDITQEFAYQFQGFCQLRCQVANHNPEILKLLSSNRDAWSLPSVISILKRMIDAGKRVSKGPVTSASPVLSQFGYFASIELARLECLCGDFSASLQAISSMKLSDRSELFTLLPICHFNVFYHAAVCNMMLRNFPEAIDIFSEIILHTSRILKPGASSAQRPGITQVLPRMMDKALALTAIVITLFPSKRVDDQVRDMIEAKYGEKFRRMQGGERVCFTELFEYASPKFISPIVPNYDVLLNINQDAFNRILSVFTTEVEQRLACLKLRSFLGLYASIDIPKLARFNDVSETDLVCLLLSYKNKSITLKPSQVAGNTRINMTDIHYYVEDEVLFIKCTTSKEDLTNKAYERFFVAGVRKHTEILNQISTSFSSLGL